MMVFGVNEKPAYIKASPTKGTEMTLAQLVAIFANVKPTGKIYFIKGESF